MFVANIRIQCKLSEPISQSPGLEFSVVGVNSAYSHEVKLLRSLNIHSSSTYKADPGTLVVVGDRWWGEALCRGLCTQVAYNLLSQLFSEDF